MDPGIGVVSLSTCEGFLNMMKARWWEKRWSKLHGELLFLLSSHPTVIERNKKEQAMHDVRQDPEPGSEWVSSPKHCGAKQTLDRMLREVPWTQQKGESTLIWPCLVSKKGVLRGQWRYSICVWLLSLQIFSATLCYVYSSIHSIDLPHEGSTLRSEAWICSLRMDELCA